METNASGMAPHPAFVPLSFGQTLDRTYRLVRACWRSMIGIALVLAAGMILIVLLMVGSSMLALAPILHGEAPKIDLSWIVPFSLAMFLMQVSQYLLLALYLPAASYASLQAQRGIGVKMGEAYRVTVKRYGSNLWALTLISFIAMAPLLVLGLVIGSLAGFQAWQLKDQFVMVLPYYIPFFILGYVGIMVYMVLVGLRRCFTFLVGVDEQIPARQALKRSNELTRGMRGRIFCVLLVIYLIVYAAANVCMIVLYLVGGVTAVAAATAHVTPGSPAFFVLIVPGVLVLFALIVTETVVLYAALITALAVMYDYKKMLLGGSPATISSPESA